MFGNYQNQLWILLSVTWWLGGLTAWMGVIADASAVPVEPGRLMLTALFVLLISATLRLPTVTSSSGTSDLQDHLVWLLSFSANVNWLGMILLKSSSLWFVAAVLVLWMIGEYWLGFLAWRNNRLTWFFMVAAKWNLLPPAIARRTSLSGLDAESSCNQVSSSGSQVQKMLCTQFEDSVSDGTQIRQTTVDGYDSDGRRYFSGALNLCWDPGQSSQTVIIGFVPAFETEPEFDFETDCETMAVRLINCTPSGIRLAVRRSEPMDSRLNRLQWFAIEPEVASLHGDIPLEKPPLP